jgi:CBS domain-containing protein/gamma-glutamylcysteine synthetase
MSTTRSHKEVWASNEGEDRRRFMRAILADLRALERMLNEGRFESGVRRIGAEQELFLVDRSFAPAPGALRMLERLGDPHFTTELGLFNLEVNLDPRRLGGDSLALLERQLTELLDRTRQAAAELELHAVLVGILPTIKKSDLGLDNMVPSPRYRALNDAMNRMRGGAFEFAIKGIDELHVKHDSVMVEACNASFQVHLQVGADEFARLYNLAQALAGPLLSAATNSPLLFGRRLWSETRIALFQQAVDTRATQSYLRDSAARVNFGNRWVERSVLEIYKEDVARFRTLVGGELDEEPMAKLDRGETPELKALRLHNGTIYRWNRACYGVLDGRPHLRIENRVMPSGPSIVDEIANAALWLGLMVEMAAGIEDITQRIEFDHAQANFTRAAREGLGANFTWLDGEEILASRLLLERLLPVAEAGLRRAEIADADVKKYLGVVDNRVRTGRNGSRWLLSSLAGMKDKGSAADRLNALVAATLARQATGRPVAEWERARLDEAGGPRQGYREVEEYMTTDLFTVQADDAVDLVANLMSWERIRHVPVEDAAHRLIGLVSYRAILRLYTSGRLGPNAPSMAVAEVMRTDIITVGPRTPTLEAIATLRRFRIGCLPVVQDGQLVGILTEENFMDIAAELLEHKLNG